MKLPLVCLDLVKLVTALKPVSLLLLGDQPLEMRLVWYHVALVYHLVFFLVFCSICPIYVSEKQGQTVRSGNPVFNFKVSEIWKIYFRRIFKELSYPLTKYYLLIDIKEVEKSVVVKLNHRHY